MDANMKAKAEEIIKKIQSDPELLKSFEEKPAKTIEQVADINIPDFLEPAIEKVIREQMKNPDADVMSIIDKFI